MRLHTILNMPAVLSIHKDWKAGESGRERGRKGGRKSAEVEIPKKVGTSRGPF
jgi:hypothetical protein